MPKRCSDPTHNRYVRASTDRCEQCDKAANGRYLAKPQTKARLNAYNRAYFAQPEQNERRKLNRRVRRYGIEEAPHGLCAICKRSPATQIDHDHATGRVRGFLCVPCNFHLGIVENAGWLDEARAYLEHATSHRNG